MTLFADLAGFTPLAEALGALGPAGTETLTHLLNSRFTPLIDEIALVFQAADEQERAGEMLRRVHETLQRYAGRIETAEIRRTFLERVSYNREVIEAFSRS